MNRRSGLGRGLTSLIPNDVVEASGAVFRELPVNSVSANEYQPRNRFDEEALVSLAESIRELGVLQPILVREIGPGRFELIAGERRWRAARRVGLTVIPAIVREIGDQGSLEQALVENLHRQDLNALEEAAAFRQLMDDFGLSQSDVAKRVGRSRSAVTNTLRLFQLPAAVQRMVAGGELSAGHARALLGHPDRPVVEELAAQVVEEGWSVRELERHIKDALGGTPDGGDGGEVDDAALVEPPTDDPPPEPGTTKPAALLELEQLLGEHLETRVSVSLGAKRGTIKIDFADLDDLERIFRSMKQ